MDIFLFRSSTIPYFITSCPACPQYLFIPATLSEFKTLKGLKTFIKRILAPIGARVGRFIFQNPKFIKKTLNLVTKKKRSPNRCKKNISLRC